MLAGFAFFQPYLFIPWTLGEKPKVRALMQKYEIKH